MRSFKPEELFDETGRFQQELKDLTPKGHRRMGSNPHANGGVLKKDLALPDFCDYSISVPQPGQIEASNTKPLGEFLRDVVKANPHTTSACLVLTRRLRTSCLRCTKRPRSCGLSEYFDEDSDGGELAQDGRVIEMLSEHTLEGMLEGYLLSGRHGFLSTYESVRARY